MTPGRASPAIDRGGKDPAAARPPQDEPQPVAQPVNADYGLLAVCSASKVNVAAELTP